VHEISESKYDKPSSQSYTPETCLQVQKPLKTVHINTKLTTIFIHAICWVSGDHGMWLVLFSNVKQMVTCSAILAQCSCITNVAKNHYKYLTSNSLEHVFTDQANSFIQDK
jgi:hypothetical protein